MVLEKGHRKLQDVVIQNKHQGGRNDGQDKSYHLFLEITTAVYHRAGPVVGNAAVVDRAADATRSRRKNRSS